MATPASNSVSHPSLGQLLAWSLSVPCAHAASPRPPAPHRPRPRPRPRHHPRPPFRLRQPVNHPPDPDPAQAQDPGASNPPVPVASRQPPGTLGVHNVTSATTTPTTGKQGRRHRPQFLVQGRRPNLSIRPPTRPHIVDGRPTALPASSDCESRLRSIHRPGLAGSGPNLIGTESPSTPGRLFPSVFFSSLNLGTLPPLPPRVPIPTAHGQVSTRRPAVLPSPFSSLVARSAPLTWPVF